jgi:rubrerythrin
MLRGITEMEIYDGTVPVSEEALAHAKKSHDLEIPDLSGDPSLDEIYDIALKRETKAYNIFMQMAMTTGNPELKTLFNNLAEEDQTHTGEMGYEG